MLSVEVESVFQVYRSDIRKCMGRILAIFDALFVAHERMQGKTVENDKMDINSLEFVIESEEDLKSYEIYKKIELLLHMQARIAHRLENQKGIENFEECCELVDRMFSRFSEHVYLLYWCRVAHTDKSHANECIEKFVSIFEKHYRQVYDVNNKEFRQPFMVWQFDLVVKALVSLDLYMENYSPLSHSILTEKASYDLDSPNFAWLDPEKRKQSKKRDKRHRRMQLRLCSKPTERIKTLTTLYKCPFFRGQPLIKARAAWVIGHSKLYHNRDFIESEKLLFETLYILKNLEDFFPQRRVIETELATVTLIDYADVLLENKKYEYAIVALERAIFCLRWRWL